MRYSGRDSDPCMPACLVRLTSQNAEHSQPYPHTTTPTVRRRSRGRIPLRPSIAQTSSYSVSTVAATSNRLRYRPRPREDSMTLTTKLGTARRVPRSRIWIEGSRLADCGFTVGASWHLFHADKSLRLVLGTSDGIRTRRVAGKHGTHPIIDITGDVVRDTFGHVDHVTVSFSHGSIVVAA